MLTLDSENSARKEAGPLLSSYLQRCRASTEEAAAAVGDTAAAGKPAADDGATAADQPVAGEGAAGTTEAAAPTPAAAAGLPSMAPVKVPGRGVVVFKLAVHRADPAAATAGISSVSGGGTGEGFDLAAAALVQQVAADLLADIDGGQQARLRQVQRIMPIQTTCRLEEAALRNAGAQLAALVAAAMEAAQGTAQQGAVDTAAEAGGATAPHAAAAQHHSVTFGIAVKQREVSGAKPAAAASTEAGGGGSGGGLGRTAIISNLASGFEVALRERHGITAAVDLRSPGWVLVAEVLPAGGTLYAALAALPRALCSLKPKLHIRAVGSAGAP